MKSLKWIFSAATLLPAISLSISCAKEDDYNKWKEIEKLYAWWDQYVDNNQLDFYDNLTAADHDWYKVIDNDGVNDLVDFSVSSHAEAVMLWAYGPGYGIWNTSLHYNRGTSELDKGGYDKSGMVAPDPNDPYDRKDSPIQVFGYVPHIGYKYLDSALNLTTAKNTLIGYHGFEDNEYELREFIENKLSIDLEDDIDISGMDLSPLIGQSYDNFGYLALATYESNSMNWVDNNVDDKYKVVPYLEVVVPPQIHAAYISYSKKMFYDGVFLSWPREFQLLCQRNLKVTIRNAEVSKSWTKNKQLLKLRCEVSQI